MQLIVRKVFFAAVAALFVALFNVTFQVTVVPIKKNEFKNLLAGKNNLCQVGYRVVKGPMFATKLYGVDPAIRALVESDEVTTFFNEHLFKRDEGTYTVSALAAATSFTEVIEDKDGVFCKALFANCVPGEHFKAYSAAVTAAFNSDKKMTAVEYVNLVYAPLLTNSGILREYFEYASQFYLQIANADPYGVRAHIVSRLNVSTTETLNRLLASYKLGHAIFKKLMTKFEHVTLDNLAHAVECYYKCMQVNTEVGVKMYFNRHSYKFVGQYSKAGSIVHFFIKTLYETKFGGDIYMNFITNDKLFDDFLNIIPTKSIQGLIDQSSERIWDNQDLYQKSIILEAVIRGPLFGFTTEEINNGCFMVYRENEIKTTLDYFATIPLIQSSEVSNRAAFMRHLFYLIAKYDTESDLFFGLDIIKNFVQSTRDAVKKEKETKKKEALADYNAAHKYGYAMLYAAAPYKALKERIEQLQFFTLTDFVQNKSLLTAIVENKDVLGLGTDLTAKQVRESYLSEADCGQTFFVEKFTKKIIPLLKTKTESYTTIYGIFKMFSITSNQQCIDFVAANGAAIDAAKAAIAVEYKDFVSQLLSEPIGGKAIEAVSNEGSVKMIKELMESLKAKNIEGKKKASNVNIPTVPTMTTGGVVAVTQIVEEPATVIGTNVAVQMVELPPQDTEQIQPTEPQFSEEDSANGEGVQKPNLLTTIDEETTVTTIEVAGVKTLEESSTWSLSKILLYSAIVLVIVAGALLAVFFLMKRQKVSRGRNVI